MIVKEHGMGWIIEPVTSDQRQALELVVEGLRKMGGPNRATSAQATDSCPEDHSRNMAS
jgi:hypothetical protein